MGLNLIILTIGVLFPGSQRDLAASLLIQAYYLVPALMLDSIDDPRIFFSNNLFIAETSIIALASSYFSSRLRFEEFQARYELKNTNSSLERTKNSLEEANQRLRQLDELKSRFFANISHELRTPLTLILAPLESVLKGEMGAIPEGLKRHVEVMHQNGLRLLKQINSLLDLTKLDAGKMTLQPRPGSLGAFFRGLVAAIQPMADKKRIVLTGQQDSALPDQSYFDRDRLEKVVLNLVFNAIKFTDEGGRVGVHLGTTPDGQLQVQVKDTGIGIAEQDLSKLFKGFPR
jgi:signal transduction histidine kinase